MKPTILITGGLGFIFSHVTEHFVKKGWRVIVLDNLGPGSHQELIDNSFLFYPHDVSKDNAVQMIVDLAPDYVIHAAAYSDVDGSISEPTYIFENNALSTLHVFEAGRRLPNLKRLLYVSTDEVYGECTHRKNETEIIFPRNPYSLSKAVGSLMRLAYDNTYESLKDKTVETRFCNIFGPRQDPRKIIPAIKRALNGGEPLPLHNGGAGYREWLYVKEIPPLIELLLEKGHRTYNVTANVGMTMLDLVVLAEKLTGKKVPVVPGNRSGMDLYYQMDGSRLREEFGWKPAYAFEKQLMAYLNEKETN